MNVRIISVTDFNGKKKDKNIWNNVRYVHFWPPTIGERLWLHDDSSCKIRITTIVKGIITGLKNEIDVYTQNLIYRLEILE